jgi:hypothetical protein
MSHPSREKSGFFTQESPRLAAPGRSSAKKAGSRFGCPGCRSQSKGRIALFERIAFHAGSRNIVRLRSRCFAKGSRNMSSHG